MRVSDPHIPRRGAYIFIALFSCLQILCGFFLIIGDSAKPSARLSLAAHTPPPLALSHIEPASGTHDQHPAHTQKTPPFQLNLSALQPQ